MRNFDNLNILSTVSQESFFGIGEKNRIFVCDFYLNPNNDDPEDTEDSGYTPADLFNAVTGEDEDDSLINNIQIQREWYLDDNEGIDKNEMFRKYNTAKKLHKYEMDKLATIRKYLNNSKYKVQSYNIKIKEKELPFPFKIDDKAREKHMYYIDQYLYKVNRDYYENTVSRGIYTKLKEYVEEFIREYNKVGDIILKLIKEIK